MESCKSNSLLNKSSLYYGIHIPSDVQTQDNESGINVLQDKSEALKLVKKYKKARFKGFTYYHEAEAFAVHGCEGSSATDGGDQSENGSPLVGEKPSQFRAPKWQDLVKLRKAIERGDLQYVHYTIWENPRYLVSLGDTPSILQEGCRYNALHVATRSNNAAMCSLILETISDPEFIKLLYGDECPENIECRRNILLDLYLNTPGKGSNETPLHFAVKDCAIDCVEVLTAYPQCDRYCKNKYGETPSMIIEKRSNLPDDYKNKYRTLLNDNFYVPVLRAEDNCTEPVIGEPFSPTSPPNLNGNPLKPRLEIHAYAGPMEKQEAEAFRKVWKKPARTLKNNIDPLITMRFRDMEKGLERLGKTLANKYRVEWKEYWPFLNSFADITTIEGLDLFEKYLAYRTTIEYSNSSIVSPDKTASNNLSDLCRAFQAFHLEDSPSQIPQPFLYVEKSCRVFANRIAQAVLNLLETEQNSITQTLKSEVKHLEQSMASYMDDVRFVCVNFNVVHSRLGALISARLKGDISLRNKIEVLLDKCNKRLDYFSSDDESMNHKVLLKKKSTSTSKQVVCLLQTILDGSDLLQIDLNNEADCMAAWKDAKPCECIWQVKGSKKSSSLSRNSSLKLGLRRINIKLKFDEDDPPQQISDDSNKETDDEEFFTPPSSPTMFQDDEDEDSFDDSLLPDKDVFIEGNQPTKTDFAVFDALRFSDCKLNPDKYPNVYRWYHTVSLYSAKERNSWTNLCATKTKMESLGATSTPVQNRSQQKFSTGFYTPPRSWLRVTGVNSPKAALRLQHNVSANL